MQDGALTSNVRWKSRSVLVGGPHLGTPSLHERSGLCALPATVLQDVVGKVEEEEPAVTLRTQRLRRPDLCSLGACLLVERYLLRTASSECVCACLEGCARTQCDSVWIDCWDSDSFSSLLRNDDAEKAMARNRVVT